MVIKGATEAAYPVRKKKPTLGTGTLLELIQALQARRKRRAGAKRRKRKRLQSAKRRGRQLRRPMRFPQRQQARSREAGVMASDWM